MRCALMPQDNIVGLILAGGQSKRMGKDKATLGIGDKTFLEQAIDVLKTVDIPLLKIVVSSKARMGYVCLPDLNPGMGPLGGLYTAMQKLMMEADSLLVIPVDMPFLTSGVINNLLARASHAKPDVEFISYEGQHFPFWISLSIRIMSILDEQIKLNQLSVHAFRKKLKTLELKTTDFDPKFFLNINTPETLLMDQG